VAAVNVNWGDVLKGAVPILIACIAWLLGQVNTFETRLTKIEASMPVLVTPDGVPTDSPHSAKARSELREHLTGEINDLKVRVGVIESKSK
jgi:hypothetical protein